MNKQKLLTCLTLLGIKPKMDCFADRKKVQKISYWLPIFGIDVDLSTNDFNWYLHGPYSPELTRTLFEIVENSDANNLETLTNEEKDQIKKIKVFLGEDIKSVDALELLVSLNYLLQIAKNKKIPTRVAVDALKEKKPYFKDVEIQRALRKLQLLPEYT